jgi:hypothetical protein
LSRLIPSCPNDQLNAFLSKNIPDYGTSFFDWSLECGNRCTNLRSSVPFAVSQFQTELEEGFSNGRQSSSSLVIRFAEHVSAKEESSATSSALDGNKDAPLATSSALGGDSVTFK